MRVVVTGATGLIGAAVCRKLAERGDEVVGLSRDRKPAQRRFPDYEWHSWWPETEPAPTRAISGADAVINLVGETINQRLTRAAKKRIRESRVDATNNLVRAIAAADHPPGVLISQSAIGRYGDTGDALVDEDTPADQGDFLGRLTVEWEDAAMAAASHGLRVVITRSGHVLAPEGGFLGELLPPFKIGIGGPIAGGRQYVSWIHIDDAAGLALYLLDNEDASGAVNSTAPNPVTNKELSKAIGRTLRRPAIAPIPEIALWPLKGRELAHAIATGQRVLPRWAIELGYRFKFPELEPALKNLLRR